MRESRAEARASGLQVSQHPPTSVPRTDLPGASQPSREAALTGPRVQAAWFRGYEPIPGWATASEGVLPSPSLADSRACGPTAAKSGPSQRQGAVGQRAQDGQHPPRGHGDLDARPGGSCRGGAGVPRRGGGAPARGGPAPKRSCPPTRSPGPLRRGDSEARRAARMAPWGAPRCSQAEKMDP